MGGKKKKERRIEKGKDDDDDKLSIRKLNSNPKKLSEWKEREGEKKN